ncbi:hypothetical protein C7212DRAFT_341857 [Tuber magnatum]|uniref:Uncharacterized protein n=1 Tax=Tuber magnatum TaxID=42249 RepID=A0A317SZ29_9PEZI|nr:hypothetical protein C7212DRAFT_341857 [Tuber magnatum]
MTGCKSPNLVTVALAKNKFAVLRSNRALLSWYLTISEFTPPGNPPTIFLFRVQLSLTLQSCSVASGATPLAGASITSAIVGATGLMTAGAADPAFLGPTITGTNGFGSKLRLLVSIVSHRSWRASYSSQRSEINLSTLTILSSMSNKTRGMESTSIPSSPGTTCPASTSTKVASMACMVPPELSTDDSKGTNEHTISEDTTSTTSIRKNLDFSFSLATGSGNAPTSAPSSTLPPFFCLTTLSLLFPFPFPLLLAVGLTPEGSGAWNDPTTLSTFPTISSACLLSLSPTASLVLLPPKSISTSGIAAPFNPQCLQDTLPKFIDEATIRPPWSAKPTCTKTQNSPHQL